MSHFYIVFIETQRFKKQLEFSVRFSGIQLIIVTRVTIHLKSMKTSSQSSAKLNLIYIIKTFQSNCYSSVWVNNEVGFSVWPVKSNNVQHKFEISCCYINRLYINSGPFPFEMNPIRYMSYINQSIRYDNNSRIREITTITLMNL